MGCNLFSPYQQQHSSRSKDVSHWPGPGSCPEISAAHSKAWQEGRHRTESARQEDSHRDYLNLGCGQTALPGKMLCRACPLEAATDKEPERTDITSLIRQTIRESLQDLSTKPSQTVTSISSPPLAQKTSKRETSLKSISEEESPVEDDLLLGFDFALVNHWWEWSEKHSIGRRKWGNEEILNHNRGNQYSPSL